MRFLQSWLSWHPWRIDSVEQCLLFTPSQLRLKVASSSCNEYRYQKVHIEKTVAGKLRKVYHFSKLTECQREECRVIVLYSPKKANVFTLAAAVNYCHFLFLFEFKQDYLSRAFLPTLELGKV